ncbi:response regulator transcription factor [Leptospira sp. GIMC2001]|uniref:response regulator transcription factor n=1 Tax=Leptospira sp. GIMC2001 TaxID=1513297 RepID=UPI00234B0324|nr:response regulator transcription factor [Leptospira sp. GIMC2001]WCL50875.1 response regulator transcription factor [Leptospira sp. GIMC2001]
MKTKKEKILIVEDDITLGESLSERLTKENYQIHWVTTLNDARNSVRNFEPDLVILDLRLPDGSGFRLAEEMNRMIVSPAFLFLTAQAGAPERLKGFELGAEEFIPKPFHLKELLIRMKRVLEKKKESNRKKIYYKGIEIRFDAFSLLKKSGEVIELSRRDCLLLDLLITNKDRTISRDEILDQLWGEDKFPTNRTVDNSIVRLRQSLDDQDSEAIRSVRGVGYQWIGDLESF